MSLITFPLFGPQAAPEIKKNCLSHLSLTELCKVGEVCKDWFELTRSKELWNPFFTELKLSNCAKNITLNAAVLSDLKNHLPLVNKIIGLIDKDEELASIVDCPSASLEKFKKMPSLQCSLHVMRALRKDSTSLFVYLPTKFLRAMANHLDQSEITYREELEYAAINFYEKEQYLPFLFELIRGPLGPYDAEKTMAVILNLLRFNLTCEKVACICAPIVKSHPNLSELFKKNFDMGNEFVGPILMPMTTLIQRTIIPHMNELGLGVTVDDWISCGLTK